MIDGKVLLNDIDGVLAAITDPTVDYMKGYHDALLAIKGMIETMEGEQHGRTEGTDTTEEGQALPELSACD